MRDVVWLLLALVTGGAAWWRWSWERWRRALIAEQRGRARDRFVARAEVVELRRAMDEWARAAGAALAEHGRSEPGLAEDLHLLLWERQTRWEERP